MTREQEDKLFERGCLATAIGLLVAAILTFVRGYPYALLFVGILGLWLIICRVRGARDQRLLERIRDQAFKKFPRTKPRIETTGSYGYPHITLHFEAYNDVTGADQLGCIAAFKSEIQSLYSHVGAKDRPFDVDYGVSVRVGEHHINI